jgi:uncharacterized protein (UPF0332 family)
MRDKSEQNWGVGITCLQKNSLNVAASRLYYGIFQAILWYARVKKGYNPSPDKQRSVHADMAVIVNEDFSSDTPRDKRFKRIFREFRTLRETADYEPDTPLVEEIKEVVSDGQLLKNHYLKAAEA